jgi:hypothetical protein
MKTREQLIQSLEEQYNKLNQYNEYPEEFKAQGHLTECNHGGIFVILSKSGDGVICWRDWSDNAISETLVECEIEYREEEETGEVEVCFEFEGNTFFMNEIMRSY